VFAQLKPQLQNHAAPRDDAFENLIRERAKGARHEWNFILSKRYDFPGL
jgi:hypothetical protein